MVESCKVPVHAGEKRISAVVPAGKVHCIGLEEGNVTAQKCFDDMRQLDVGTDQNILILYIY